MYALSKKLASLLIAVALFPLLAFAEVPDRVGRIAYLSGSVQFYSEGGQGWVTADLNAPVTSRNSLFAGPDGRAEVRIGGTAVTLDANTQLDIQVLDDESFRARVGRGSISLRVPQVDFNDTIELTAGSARYLLLQSGRYRLDADEAGSTLAVFSGQADAYLPGKQIPVTPGTMLSVNGNGHRLTGATQTTLDLWATQRDESLRISQATQYVSPNMTGYEELDANGRWESDPDYGTVWYPTTYVSPGWAPYRDGRWVYVAPWGWTWVDAAPWGFAPFHYGRWVRIGSSWAWTPGSYVRRPSYAPALVSFVGGVPGASLSIGVHSSVSWYPLAPWETYRPAYRHHSHHLNNINNFRIKEPPHGAIRTVENRRVHVNQLHGSTEVPHAALVESRPLGHNYRQAAPTNIPENPGVNGRRRPEAASGPVSGSGESWRRNPAEGSAGWPVRNAVESPGPTIPPGERRPATLPGPAPAPALAPVPAAPEIPARKEHSFPMPTMRPPISETPVEPFRRNEGWQRNNPVDPRPEAPVLHNRSGGGFGARSETQQPKPVEIAPPKMRSEPGFVRPEQPRMEFQSRPAPRAPEAMPEQKREKEPERPGGRTREGWQR